MQESSLPINKFQGYFHWQLPYFPSILRKFLISNYFPLPLPFIRKFLLYQCLLFSIISQKTSMGKPIVIFILGGPGSGKGTQSDLIRSNFKFVHLSAGDLLRAERKKEGSENGALIQKYIVEGKIVPSAITVALLKQAMEENGWEDGRFLIDGFPRNKENLGQWNAQMEEKVNTPFIVYLDCPEQVMLQRLLKRAETSGRSDDNEEVIKKRFHTYREETIPVIKEFQKSDRVVQVSATGNVEDVFGQLSQSFKKRGVV